MKKGTKFFIVIAIAIALLYFYSRSTKEEEKETGNNSGKKTSGENSNAGERFGEFKNPDLWYENATTQEILDYVAAHQAQDADKEADDDDVNNATASEKTPFITEYKLIPASIYQLSTNEASNAKRNRLKGFLCKQY